MFLDGFKYWLASTKGSKRYFRCSRSKSSKCPGKLIMENDKILSTSPHDHEKETRINIIEKFRKNLTKKAVDKPNKSLVDIYLEETQNHSEASILYPFSQAESTMRKARGKNVEKSEEKSEKKVENLKICLNQKYFYQDDVEDVIVVLMNQGTMKVIGRIEEIHIDCRIKVELEGKVHQLVTVLALLKGRECPIAFGLFPSLNFQSLITFFNHLKQKFSSNLFPSVILTSTDQLLQSSIFSSFPDANIKIMFFYYAHSILKPLSKDLQTLSKNVFNLSSLKMILAIPLIPTNYVIPGWEALRKWMLEKNVDLNSICDFVYAQWLAEGAERISIFNGLAHSINNHTQVFNRELINGLGLEGVKKREKLSRKKFKLEEALKSNEKFKLETLNPSDLKFNPPDLETNPNGLILNPPDLTLYPTDLKTNPIRLKLNQEGSKLNSPELEIIQSELIENRLEIKNNELEIGENEFQLNEDICHFERREKLNFLTNTFNSDQVITPSTVNQFSSSTDFVDKLLKIASKNFFKFSKTNESQARKAQKLQKIVKFATKTWISSPFHLRRPIQFLQQISHCIDDGMINFVANYCDEIESGKNLIEITSVEQATLQRELQSVFTFTLEPPLEPPPLIYFNSEKSTENSNYETNFYGSSEPPPLVLIKRKH